MSDKEKKGANLRSWRNILVDPVFQFSFAGYIVIAIAVYSAISLAVVYRYTDQIALLIHEMSETPESFVLFLLEKLQNLSVQLIAMTLFFIFIVFAIMIIETHRIAGASYSIKRFITDSLQKGDFSGRITLRKKDYFVDVAESLNEFADQLEKNKVVILAEDEKQKSEKEST